MSSTPVLVLSDDLLFTQGLLAVLRTASSISIVRPDDEAARDVHILILDARSKDAARRLAAAGSGARPYVILVGAEEDDDWAIDALSMGARGILTRTASRTELLEAIAIVGGGGIWARRRWLNACLQRRAGTDRARIAATAIVSAARLSRREAEVFRYAATGAANKEIASQLSISEATVKVHLTRTFQKLGVSGRAELAALYCGLRQVPTASPVAQFKA